MGNSLDSEPDSSAGFHYSHWDHLFPISIAIVCTFFLTIIFLTVFFAWMKSQLQYRMEVENIRDERHSYDAGMIWKRRGQEDWELVHGYIVRDGLNVNYSAGIDKPQASGSRGSFPSKGLVDIKLSSEHLSVNGVRLIPTSASRIFVLTEPGIQVPMTLSSQELAMFHPEVYPLSLEKSDLWRTKFKSLVDPGVIDER